MDVPDFNWFARAVPVALSAGFACRTALAWVSRPSEGTAVYQSKLTRTRAFIPAAVAVGLVAVLFGFPAIVVLPALNYLLLRLISEWQDHWGPKVVTNMQLFLMSRLAEVASVAVLWLMQGKPLS